LTGSGIVLLIRGVLPERVLKRRFIISADFEDFLQILKFNA
jgi:hypothetical protein